MVLTGNFPQFIRDIAHQRDTLEAVFRDRIREVLNGGNRKDRQQVVSACWQEAILTEEQWLSRVDLKHPLETDGYTEAWRNMNRMAGLDEFWPTTAADTDPGVNR
jgi:hypothetical protein